LVQPTDKDRSDADALDFARQASAAQIGFLHEFWLFLRQNKKWWLTPLLVILLVFGVLVVLGGTAVAPFIYTLF
jgi:drug/metabolite transporter superfamily protein YnfA